MALALLFHALLKLLPGLLHRQHLLLQLIHVTFALLVLLLGILQGLLGSFQFFNLMGCVFLGLDILGALLVQLRILFPGETLKNQNAYSEDGGSGVISVRTQQTFLFQITVT